MKKTYFLLIYIYLGLVFCISCTDSQTEAVKIENQQLKRKIEEDSTYLTMMQSEMEELYDNLDSIILWDPKVMHGVASIYPKNSKKVAFRDVLLIGFSHAPKLQSPTGNSDLDYKEVKKNIKEYKSAVFAQTEVV